MTKKLLSALSLTTNYIVLNRKATKEQSQWKKKLHFFLFEPDEKELLPRKPWL